MAVEDPPQDVVDWEALVQDVEEHLAQFGGHEGVEKGLNHKILHRLRLLGCSCWTLG